jgi:transcriptional regulator with XRE-family HTH domain
VKKLTLILVIFLLKNDENSIVLEKNYLKGGNSVDYFDVKKFGERVKEMRELRKMTQEELALKIGYSNRRQIQRIEVGTMAGSVDKLFEISKALNISTDYLLFGKEYKGDDKILQMFANKTLQEEEYALKVLVSIFDNKGLLIN